MMEPWPVSADALKLNEQPTVLNSLSVSGTTDGPDRHFSWFQKSVDGIDNPQSARRYSIGVGLFGLAMLTLAGVLFVPLSFKLLTEFWPFGPPPWLMLLIIGGVIAPGVTAISNVAIMPMLWRGSLLLRFLVVLAILAPGYFIFMVSLYVIENSAPPTDVWYAVLTAECGFLAGVAIVIVPVQLSTQCYLSGYQRERPAKSQLSIGTLMELMVVIAVICAIVQRLEISSIYKLTIFVCALLGSFMAIVTLLAIFGVMGRVRPRLYGIALPLLIGSIAISGVVIFLGKRQFGFSNNAESFLMAYLDGLLLISIYYCLVRVSIWWLRGCGWQFCLPERSV